MQRRQKATNGNLRLTKRNDKDAKLGRKPRSAQWYPFWIIGGIMLLVAATSLGNATIGSSQSSGSRELINIGGKLSDGAGVEYHIVFSTGCSLYQDWQSFVFFYQAMVVKQPGTVTRIVSGCDKEDQATLQTIFDEQIRPMEPERFKIHFTPDYSDIKGGTEKFVYFNKPFGMKHWLENALGFPDRPLNEDAIVILMDPDQLIIRPFANNNFTNTEWKFLKEGQAPQTRIEHGKPMGQMYGFDLQWQRKIDMTKVVPNEVSPVTDMPADEARAGYIVGPPYVATGKNDKVTVFLCLTVEIQLQTCTRLSPNGVNLLSLCMINIHFY